MKARALLDIPDSDVKAGEFFDAPDAMVVEMVAAGSADDKVTEADVYGAATPPDAKAIEGPGDPNAPADLKAASRAKAEPKAGK